MTATTEQNTESQQPSSTKNATNSNGKKTIQNCVLAGNPNVGKSIFFNALTGMYVNVSNFPGTTVDIPKGTITDTELTLKDTPGVYGLSRMSDEEKVAERAILEGDVIINVISALTLERDLFLTLQMIDYEKPMVVALNQMDEAEARHIKIDTQKLEALLGVPVIPTIAVQHHGIDTVKTSINKAATGRKTPEAPDIVTLKTLEDNPAERMLVYGGRRQHVNAIASQVVTRRDPHGQTGKTVSRNIGSLLLNPFFGLISLLAVLFALYQVVGVWVAGDIVDFLEGQIFLGDNPEFFVGVIPVLQGLVNQFIPKDTFLFDVLAGEFGVITMSIQYIFGVLFPLVLGFYLYISVLEDCGYLPRVAVLADGLLTKIGLNGRAVIPLILGFGCVTMATVSTRVLTSQRERTIASTILAVTIPCSAQLAVIMALMAVGGGATGWGIYVAVLAGVMIFLGTILNGVLPGKSSALILDLPPMRLPMPGNILKKSWVRTKIFLLEAAPLFIWGSLIVAVLHSSGLLTAIEKTLAPLTQAILHLPGETAQVFIMGMVRRDFGAAGLLFMQDTLSATQILTTLIVITLFVPCLASTAVIWKERGMKETLTILAGSWLIAFGTGAIVTRVLEAFSVL